MHHQCELSNPCSNMTSCINLEPGFRCTECPSGYTGSNVKGVGLNDTTTQQVYIFSLIVALFLSGSTCILEKRNFINIDRDLLCYMNVNITYLEKRLYIHVQINLKLVLKQITAYIWLFHVNAKMANINFWQKWSISSIYLQTRWKGQMNKKATFRFQIFHFSPVGLLICNMCFLMFVTSPNRDYTSKKSIHGNKG